VSDDSDDEDVEYKGHFHFCSECSIPPPGGVRGRVHGYGGVGLTLDYETGKVRKQTRTC